MINKILLQNLRERCDNLTVTIYDLKKRESYEVMRGGIWQRVYELRLEGHTAKTISDELKVSTASVNSFIYKNPQLRTGKGRRSNIDPEIQKRAIDLLKQGEKATHIARILDLTIGQVYTIKKKIKKDDI